MVRIKRSYTKRNNTDKYGGTVYRGPRHRPTWSIWLGMRGRCHNPKNKSYRFYGARGVRVCKRWLSFGNFLVDMGERPKGHSIDRIDPFRCYEPGNCHWVSSQAGMRKRNNLMITYNGITLNAWQWSIRLGICPRKIYRRLRAGHPVEIVLSMVPVKRVGKIPGRRWSGITLIQDD